MAYNGRPNKKRVDRMLRTMDRVADLWTKYYELQRKFVATFDSLTPADRQEIERRTGISLGYNAFEAWTDLGA